VLLSAPFFPYACLLLYFCFMVCGNVAAEAFGCLILRRSLDGDVVLACCVEELKRLVRVLRALLPSLPLLERNDLSTAHAHSWRIVFFTEGCPPSFFRRHRFFLQQRRLPYVVDLHVYQRDCPLPVILTSSPELATPSVVYIHSAPQRVIFFHLLLGPLHNLLFLLLAETIIFSLERTV